ncbi:hypothetical protein [Limisphaera sp. VF-2]|uniref:hypothetical protein n=1 Tax=Limisphaera sp. VF-2 TaxID=3400418 RepID=UPI003C2D3D33
MRSQQPSLSYGSRQHSCHDSRGTRSLKPDPGQPTTTTRLILAVLLASTLGPYILGPLRLDHLLIYPLGIVSIVRLFPTAYYTIPVPLLFVAGLLGANVVWCLATTIAYTSLSTDMLSALDNFLQPLLTLCIAMALIQNTTQLQLNRLFTSTCYGTLAVFSFNALLAFAMSRGYLLDLAPYFVRSITETGQSVWANALSTGRYTGIFDQPLETGLGYSVALLAWAFLVFAQGRRTALLFAALPLLLLGGVLAASKTFLLGGIPLFLTTAVLLGLKRSRRALTVCAALFLALLSLLAGITFSETTIGGSYARKFLDQPIDSPMGAIAHFTSHRLAGAAVNLQLMQRVLSTAPFRGFGYAPPDVPLDNGYLEFLYRGGLISLVLYLLVHLVFCVAAWGGRLHRRPLALWSFLLLVLLLGAALGGPTLTMNRVSVPVWFMLAFSCALLSRPTALSAPRPTGHQNPKGFAMPAPTGHCRP